MQAADQPAKLSASSQFRDTSTSMKAKDASRKTLDAHFKINSNKHVTDQTIFLTFDDGARLEIMNNRDSNNKYVNDGLFNKKWYQFWMYFCRKLSI